MTLGFFALFTGGLVRRQWSAPVMGFVASRALLGLCLALCAIAVSGVPADAQSKARESAARDAARDQKARRSRLTTAKSWGYQLRIRDLAPLAASDPDVAVIDHGLAARRDGKLLFDATEIVRLKTRADGRRRVVLAYLSIGEAEQYRFYWQEAWCHRTTAPAWVGAVNPNWPGNYPVRFWDAGWQRLILDGPESYLARIQAQGFDGIYLDRADVWSEWRRERPGAERDMIDFLAAIAKAARARDPAFLIVMQNAEELLAHTSVRRLLDGVAKEDLLYGINFTEAPNDAETIASATALLRRAGREGLGVFAVEYLVAPALIAAARARLDKLGFVPTFAPRLLDAPSRTGLEPMAAAAAGSPAATPPQVAAPRPSATPSGSWAEGGPTCLLD